MTKNITLVNVDPDVADMICQAIDEFVVKHDQVLFDLAPFPKIRDLVQAKLADLSIIRDNIDDQAHPAPAQHFDMRDADTRNNHDYDIGQTQDSNLPFPLNDYNGQR